MCGTSSIRETWVRGRVCNSIIHQQMAAEGLCRHQALFVLFLLSMDGRDVCVSAPQVNSDVTHSEWQNVQLGLTWRSATMSQTVLHLKTFVWFCDDTGALPLMLPAAINVRGSLQIAHCLCVSGRSSDNLLGGSLSRANGPFGNLFDCGGFHRPVWTPCL